MRESPRPLLERQSGKSPCSLDPRSGRWRFRSQSVQPREEWCLLLVVLTEGGKGWVGGESGRLVGEEKEEELTPNREGSVAL